MELTSQSKVRWKERREGKMSSGGKQKLALVGCHAKYDVPQIRLRGPEDHAAGCCDWRARSEVPGAIGACHRKEGAEIGPVCIISHYVQRTIWEVGT